MKFAMLTSMAIALVLGPCIRGKEQGCGGLLEGDNGKFRYRPQAVADGKNPPNCVWLVQAYGATQIKLTLDEFLPGGDDNAVVFYSDTAPGETDSNPITLNAQSIGSTLTLQGSTVVVILPQSNSSLAFTWDSTLPDGFNPTALVTLADYIEVPEGELTWTPARRQEKLWWIIGAGVSADDTLVEWKTQVDLSDCDRNHPCSCLSFGAFELSTDGYLLEVSRTCGRSSSGVFQMQSSPLVVTASANTTEPGASKVELHWVEDHGPSTTTSITTTTSRTTTTSTTASPTTTTSTTTATVPPETQPSIYFTTYYGGLSAFLPETNQVKKILHSTENLGGIAYDSIDNKLYWSSTSLPRSSKIYRSNKDGSEVETIFSIDKYRYIYGMAFDGIGGNVYVTTYDGYILACGGGATQTFNCYTILDNQIGSEGICLHPDEGLMYWGIDYLGSIRRAGMDGSNPVTLFTGLGYVCGLTIDFASRRLYWAEDNKGDKIQSSDLDGKDIRLVVQLPSGSDALGVAVLNDRVYWGISAIGKLQSATKNGQDLQTLYTHGQTIHHLVIVPALDRPTARANDCEGRNCSTLCVLSPTCFRCLD